MNVFSLKGCPDRIKGDCDLSDNNFKNLYYSPQVIFGDLIIKDCNKLESLEGFPKVVGGDIKLIGNEYLFDLKGISEEINGNLDLSNTPIIYFENGPEVIHGDLIINVELLSIETFEYITDEEILKFINVKGEIRRNHTMRRTLPSSYYKLINDMKKSIKSKDIERKLLSK